MTNRLFRIEARNDITEIVKEAALQTSEQLIRGGGQPVLAAAFQTFAAKIMENCIVKNREDKNI